VRVERIADGKGYSACGTLGQADASGPGGRGPRKFINFI